MDKYVAVIREAHAAADKVTAFYAAAVGSSIDTNAEFVLLSDWMESIHSGLSAARALQSRLDIEDMVTARAECKMWLNSWTKH